MSLLLAFLIALSKVTSAFGKLTAASVSSSDSFIREKDHGSRRTIFETGFKLFDFFFYGNTNFLFFHFFFIFLAFERNINRLDVIDTISIDVDKICLFQVR